MPKIYIAAAPQRIGASYPEPFKSRVGDILRRQLGNAAGLTQFGVNLTTLEPGKVSSVRHWHENQDEFVFVVSGEVMLIDDDGETHLRAGEAAGFQAGDTNAHQIANRSSAPATFLEIGTRTETERGHYPDDDLAFHLDASGRAFTHKDGSPY